MTIDLDRAIELYKLKLEADAKKLIKSFDENPDVQILDGRWGPFLKIGKNNYKLPKTAIPEELTLEECLSIAESQGTTKKRGKK